LKKATKTKIKSAIIANKAQIAFAQDLEKLLKIAVADATPIPTIKS